MLRYTYPANGPRSSASRKNKDGNCERWHGKRLSSVFCKKSVWLVAVRGLPLSVSTRLRWLYVYLCVNCNYSMCVWSRIRVLNGHHGGSLCVKENPHVWPLSISLSKRTGGHTENKTWAKESDGEKKGGEVRSLTLLSSDTFKSSQASQEERRQCTDTRRGFSQRTNLQFCLRQAKKGIKKSSYRMTVKPDQSSQTEWTQSQEVRNVSPCAPRGCIRSHTHTALIGI